MGPFESTAIIGANGMLAADLRAAIERDGEFGRVVCADIPEVDIVVPQSLQRFLRDARPEIIFNCAAYTDVDGCEKRPELAFAVNGEGAGNVAAVADRLGALVVHIGTDYIFDGVKGAPYVEEDAPNPLSVYAKSKLEGERRVANGSRRWLIVRTGWLYGAHRENMVDKVLKLCRTDSPLRGPADLVGSPTWTRDLAEAMALLARRRAEGVFHVVNKGGCSRFDQVKAITEAAGVNREVVAVSAADFPRPARVPPYSVLSVAKLEKETGCHMRPWREALEEYVRTASPARFAAS